MCFFLMIRRPPRSTLDRSSAASDVYKRQERPTAVGDEGAAVARQAEGADPEQAVTAEALEEELSLIHISEPTRPY